MGHGFTGLSFCQCQLLPRLFNRAARQCRCARMCMCSQVVAPPDLITAFQHNTTSRSLSIRTVSPWGIVQTQTVTVCSVPRLLTLKYLSSDCLLRCSDTSIIFSFCDEFLVCYTTNFLAFSCICPSPGLELTTSPRNRYSFS